MLCCRRDRGHILGFEEYSDILAEYATLLTYPLANVLSLSNRRTGSRMSCSMYLCGAPMIKTDWGGSAYESGVYKSLQEVDQLLQGTRKRVVRKH
jgi:hypothetical protein